jgi:dTDP-4-dehydrorhamnose reductase
MKQKVLVTGSHGFLASLVMLYNGGNFDFEGVSRSDVDYSNPQQVGAYFADKDFDIIFHTAANATTAACEGDPEGTHKVNCESAIEIAKVCRDRGKRMIFISTEQLFNGKSTPGPFDESEEPESVTNYGRQKAEVDAWMRENMDDYVILRLSWQFGLALPHVRVSPGILINVVRALRTDTPTLFTVNEHRCMTYAQHLADGFKTITGLDSGVYNIASENHLNTYECARLVAKKLGCSEEKINRIILPNHERYADRHRDFRLDGSKAKAAGIPLASFEEDVDQCLSDFGLA